MPSSCWAASQRDFSYELRIPQICYCKGQLWTRFIKYGEGELSLRATVAFGAKGDSAITLPNSFANPLVHGKPTRSQERLTRLKVAFSRLYESSLRDPRSTHYLESSGLGSWGQMPRRPPPTAPPGDGRQLPSDFETWLLRRSFFDSQSAASFGFAEGPSKLGDGRQLPSDFET